MGDKYLATASAGEIEITIDGDVGGNGQTTTIAAKFAQFECSEYVKTPDGFELKIHGTWEIAELAAALSKSVLERSQHNWVTLESE